jgi:hypothetical protein
MAKRTGQGVGQLGSSMLAGARFFERLAMGHGGVNDQSPE